MHNKQIVYKAKAVICFCLFFPTGYLMSQNTGDFKYITTSMDTCRSGNLDVLEVNNQYYLLSHGESSSVSHQTIPVVTVFDKDLNMVEQILLPEGERGFAPYKFFYEKNFFYVFGISLDSHLTRKNCFAKFDEDFNLVQPLSLYGLSDTLEYRYKDILVTTQKEFLCLIAVKDRESRLWYINNHGDILQEVFLPHKVWWGTGAIAETDSNYFVSFRYEDSLWRFSKDSPKKQESMYTECCAACSPEGTMVAIGNQLIRSNSYINSYDECSFAGETNPLELDIYIDFLNEDMSIEKNLVIGQPCSHDNIGEHNMNYINPDSIYYAYVSTIEFHPYYTFGKSTISIACFSSEGQLHFNHALKLPDTISMKAIFKCKALSDGGVLVCGLGDDGLNKTRGFLLLYHPQRDDLSIKMFPIETKRDIYPNPAQSCITITNTENSSLYIYNTLGQEVLHTNSTEENTTVNIEHLLSGIYVLKVIKDNSSSTYKIQVIR